MDLEQLFGSALPTLESERLRLRHPRATEAPRILSLFGDDKAMRYWSHEPFRELEQAQDYLQSIDDGFSSRSLFQWGFTERESDELIGTVTLYEIGIENRRAEIGYMLDRKHWRKGFGREAVSRVLDFAFDEMGLHRIEADTDPRNLGSIGLLESLGFVREGYLRERWFTYGEWCDSILYGLLANERVSQ